MTKELKWLGTSRHRLKNFPDLARREAGEQLWRLQTGRNPFDWKPMRAIGLHAAEIRINKPFAHRVIYVASYFEAIYVLHVFAKKTQQTAQKDIDIARTNYAKLQTERKGS